MDIYYEMIIEGATDIDFEELKRIATLEFQCDGIEEFCLDEAQIDESFKGPIFTSSSAGAKMLEQLEQIRSERIKVFFSANKLEKLQHFEEFLKEHFPGLSFKVIEQKCVDWNKQWRKYYRPIEISPRLRLVPEWLRGDEVEARDLIIYPGMGFGTGEHETTFLCLQLLDKVTLNSVVSKGGECLDFGCGSGILGIAAMKLLLMKILFCDIDKGALDNCVQNLSLNFQTETLNGSVVQSRERMKKGKEFDLVFANILLSVLQEERDIIVDSVKKSGILILSGLLKDQVQEIIESYNSLDCLEVATKGEWAALLLKKKDA